LGSGRFVCNIFVFYLDALDLSIYEL
jgi:hypothetical protein